MKINTDEAVLKAPEVAELLQVSERWVYRAAQEGRIPSFRIGRCVRFSTRSLEQWIEDSMEGAFAQEHV